MLEQLALNTLSKLDGGKIGEALRAHLNRAANDCMDRPADGKARTVVLKVTLTPVMDDGGDCSEVKGQFNITSKVPDHKTKLLSFGARRGACSSSIQIARPTSTRALCSMMMRPTTADLALN